MRTIHFFARENGKYAGTALFREALEATLNAVEEFNGFRLVLEIIGEWCLKRAMENAGNHLTADLWIERYRALRGIK